MVKQLIRDQLHLDEQPTGSFNRSSIHFGGNMKIQFMKTLLMLGLLIGVGNVTTRAQALSEGTIEADVPFAFTVRDTTLPAGKYTVKRLDQTEPLVLEISSATGRAAVMFEAENAQTAHIPRKAELVFDKIGDQYFLAQIWADDTDLGYQVPKTKEEQRLESSGMQTEHHSVLAQVFRRTKKEK
jgi:hypothetical protein